MPDTPLPHDRPADDHPPMWTFRGHALSPAEFNTAMLHYYRAEIDRANVWRTRLDATTNWAILAAGAAIAVALISAQIHHTLIILATLLVTVLVWIEARRYRYYELWAHRTRLMETDFFAAMLVPPFAPSPEWAESLAESLLQPDFPISMWEAFGRRFRRNYGWIFALLGAAWILKTYLHPAPAGAWPEYAGRLAIGPVPGEVVLTVGLLFNLALLVIGLLTAGLTQATGEVLPKVEGELPILGPLWRSMEVRDSAARPKAGAPPQPGAAVRTFRRRKQLLALVISAKPQAIAERVFKELRRGATALHGRGMYAQQEREVLLVAITVTEMPRLKSIVRTEDPNAFVIVAPAQEILGRGFQPLETP